MTCKLLISGDIDGMRVDKAKISRNSGNRRLTRTEDRAQKFIKIKIIMKNKKGWRETKSLLPQVGG